MAMMITKFHKLIQSRLLWAVFLVIIVFTFVIWGMNTPGSSDREAQLSAGKLFGKSVTGEDLNMARAHARLGLMLMMGRELPASEKMNEYLTQTAWQRLAELKLASNLKLTATDEEVLEGIQSLPFFRADQKFSKPHYRAFVHQTLPEWGYNEAFFEAHVREELTLGKLRSMVMHTVLVPPVDVDRAFHALNDQFTVAFAELAPALVEKDVTVSAEQAKAFFESDPARYTLPPKVRVQVVFFDPAKFVDPAQTFTEDQLRDYYNENLDAFRKPVTGVEGAAGADAQGPKFVTQIFEEVKNEIAEKLRMATAREVAEQKAGLFVDELIPDRRNRAEALTFEAAAQKSGVTIQEPAPFADSEVPEGLAAGPALTQAAFELKLNPAEYFSNPVEEASGFYVLGLKERIAARVPGYDEVADRVTKDAKAKAVQEALRQRADMLRKVALKPGDTFQSAAKAMGLEVKEPAPFAASTGMVDTEYSRTITQAIVPMQAGEVSEPLPTMNQSLLVVKVIKREPADPAALASVHQQVAAMLKRERGPAVAGAWSEYLLKKAGFEPRQNAPASDEDEDLPETEDAEPAPDGEA